MTLVCQDVAPHQPLRKTETCSSFPAVKELVKSMMYKLAPGLADRFFSYRHRRHNDNVAESRGLPRVLGMYVARYGHSVQAGPFIGMKYVNRATGSTATPKLVGSYECELHPWIARLCSQSYDRIVDIGCAEGYYAVGLARQIPSATVVGFDLDPLSRELCAEMARLNNVADRVSIQGKCTAKSLSDAITGRTLIISDCEGFELDLLDPVASPRLKSADMLVELHDVFRPGLTVTLRRRFESTHHFELVSTQPRAPLQFDSIAFLSASDQLIALEELRNGPQDWALLTVK
jgi:SAM-dependent methyltransferase